jgi:Domain of unknown function (DUF4185)
MTRTRKARWALAGAAALACAAQGSEALADSITIPSSSEKVCSVSNENAGVAANALSSYGMTAGDLGITVYDGTRTWVFFGDTMTTPAGEWNSAADATGYFAGTNAASQTEGLCGGMSLVSIADLGVFAPDPVVPPAVCHFSVLPGPSAASANVVSPCRYESVGDFVFQPTSDPPASVGPLPTASAIPGQDEVPTGAFAYAGEIYAFYQGAPWWSTVVPGDLPVGSVSYLTAWTPSQTISQPLSGATSRQIFSSVDFNLSNPSSPEPDKPAGTPPVPPGWPSAPPLGGHFIQVAPVVDAANGTLYLFGTGEYRLSHIYLASIPLPAGPLEDTLPSVLANTTGLQTWAGPTEGWSSSPTAAAPLAFDDDAVADAGELSVQYFAAQGVWMMMYAPSVVSESHFAGDVIARYATAPTGPWSDAAVLSSGAGLYAPYMLPYLTPDPETGIQSLLYHSFTGYYVASTFNPYGNQLMSFTVTFAAPIIVCTVCGAFN